MIQSWWRLPVVLALVLLGCDSSGRDFDDSLGSSVLFFYREGGKGVTITGISGLTEDSGAVVIPLFIDKQPVTSLGRAAFKNQTNLTQVTIPRGIDIIEEEAFLGTSLRALTIPGSVTVVGSRAFKDTPLVEVILEDGVAYIGEGAFQGDLSLSKVSFPETLTFIGDEAFSHTDLEELILPDRITKIGNGAFHHSDLTKIILPENLIFLGDDAFADNELTEITIPGTVDYIGIDAFQDNPLRKVVLGRGMTSLDAGVFQGLYTLEEVSLPTSLVTIGNDAFLDTHLERVIIPDGVVSIGSRAFKGTDLVHQAIPNSVRTIGDQAFYGSSLASLTLGRGISSLGQEAFDDTFLTRVTINAAAAPVIEGARPFPTESNDIVLRYPQKGRGYNRDVWLDFENRLEELFLFEPVQGGDALEITGLTPRGAEKKNLKIPFSIQGNPVVSIGEDAFKDNEAITRVVIPDSVKTIGPGAFYHAVQLKEVDFGEGVVLIGEFAFRETALVQADIPASVDLIDDYAFYETPLVTVNIEKGATTISDFAFYNNKSLSNLTLGDGIISIGKEAFTGSKLTSVTIPSSVISIEEDAFRDVPLSRITMLSSRAPEVDEDAFPEDPDIALVYPQGSQGYDSGVWVDFVRSVQR